MQSQLLKRFESSWYAAMQTVRRMRDAIAVLLRVIAERGVVPPPEVISDLVGEIGDDDTFPQRRPDRRSLGRLRGRDFRR